MTDNLNSSLLKLFEYSVSQLDEAILSKDDKASFQSFVSSIGKQNLEYYTLETALKKWDHIMAYVSLNRENTRKRYRRYLSKNYDKKFNEEEDYTSVLKRFRVMSEIDELNENNNSTKPLNAFDTCQYLLENKFDNELDIWADIILMSALNIGADYKDVISMKDDDSRLQQSQASYIKDKNKRTKQQRYVFNLNQWSECSLNSKKNLSEVLDQANSAYTPEDIAVCAWIEAAQKAGIEDPAIKSLIPYVPKAHAYLDLVTAASAEDFDKSQVKETVANVLIKDLRKWYTIRLFSAGKDSKSKKTGKELAAEFIVENLHNSDFNNETLYASMDYIRERAGKKVLTKKPLIANFMFVLASPRDLTDIEKTISPYGRLRRNGNLYGIVPHEAMDAFRKANAIFVTEDDIENEDCNAPQFQEGDIVGYEATSIYGNNLYEIIQIENKGTKAKDIAIKLKSLERNTEVNTLASKLKLYKAAIKKIKAKAERVLPD